MAKLSVGIVGLPNVGKSTLFNALLKKQAAHAANFPFATIEPNVGIVPVPDKRLGKLAKIYSAPEVPATIEFVDIAGLIEGAHKGEGLGNKFLSHIREVDAICFVLRDFTDENIIREGSQNPKSDLAVLKTELELADFETQEKHKKKKNQDGQLPLLSKKPFLVAVNVDETQLKNSSQLEKKYAKELEVGEDQIIIISAQIESDIAGLSEADQTDYLSDLGVKQSGLERLIKKAFSTLGLITFLTAGEKEVRAWTIKLDSTAVLASGTIHTDFMKHFIKADVCELDTFIAEDGWKNARENGKVRSEGRDYIVKDGEVIEFKIGK